MSSLLHTNGILTGIIDYFCLCCETHFTLEEDANSHISNPIHLNKLQCDKYLEKFTDNGIRKFQMGYHCQFCNKLFSTLSAVSKHVESDNHIQTMGRQLLKREENATCISFKHSLIRKSSWEGIINNTCVICDQDIESLEHINSKHHTVNLIQKEIFFHGSNNVFRKVDSKTVQCLTCNQLVEVQTSSIHIEQLDHINKLGRNTSDVRKDANLSDDIENKDILPGLLLSGDETENVTAPQNKQSVYLKEENNNVANAKTKTMFESRNIDSSTNDNELNCEHKQNKLSEASTVNNENVSKSNPESVDKSKTEDRQKYARDNHLTIDNAHALCKICRTSVSSAMKCLKEHVSGAKHQKQLKTFSEQNVHNKKLITCKYLKRDPICTDTHVFLDEKISISLLSFHITTTLGQGETIHLKRCQLCERNLLIFELKDHWKSTTHLNRLRYIPVITEFTNEFIREVRKGIFHCGFCNCLEASQKALEDHLKSFEHVFQKKVAEHRLRLNLTILQYINFLNQD